MEIKRFLEKLSSDSPTPGGGSASAMAGALSAALVAMTAGLSQEKGQLEQKEVKEIGKKALTIQKRLLKAVDEDAKSYEAVLRAFRLPKNTEKERLIRSKAVQKAYQKATVTPQLVCRHSLQLLEYSNTLILNGNPHAVSDAGVAAFLAEAALGGGLLNISINLISGVDEIFERKMHLLMAQWTSKRNDLMRKILKTLSEIH